MKNKFVIRKKELKDCEAWIDINISSWNDNLKGIVSDRVLKLISSNKDEKIKHAIETFKEDDNHYVLEEENRVVGILKIKNSNRYGLEDCGEIQMLYLLSTEMKKGYGKALVETAFQILSRKGFKKIVIGCLDGNSANTFYKHLGGRVIRQEDFHLFGEVYKENIYLYEIK